MVSRCTRRRAPSCPTARWPRSVVSPCTGHCRAGSGAWWAPGASSTTSDRPKSALSTPWPRPSPPHRPAHGHAGAEGRSGAHRQPGQPAGDPAGPAQPDDGRTRHRARRRCARPMERHYGGGAAVGGPTRTHLSRHARLRPPHRSPEGGTRVRHRDRPRRHLCRRVLTGARRHPAGGRRPRHGPRVGGQCDVAARCRVRTRIGRAARERAHRRRHRRAQPARLPRTRVERGERHAGGRDARPAAGGRPLRRGDPHVVELRCTRARRNGCGARGMGFGERAFRPGVIDLGAD